MVSTSCVCAMFELCREPKLDLQAGGLQTCQSLYL